MKFNEIDPDKWQELQPYLDTCLLPVTGLEGVESPEETTKALEELRDVMDLLEIPFKGRIVTYPALHYITSREIGGIRTIVDRIRAGGFRYVIVASARLNERELSIAGADLNVSMIDLHAANEAPGTDVSQKVQALWNKKASSLPD